MWPTIINGPYVVSCKIKKNKKPNIDMFKSEYARWRIEYNRVYFAMMGHVSMF